METEDLFVRTDPQALPPPTNIEMRQVSDKSYNAEKKQVLSLSGLELFLRPDLKQQQVCEDDCQVAVMDVGWRKKWGAGTGIFIVLMLVMSAIPHEDDCHDFADQRKLFLGN
jgi:hypothetical protein